MSEPIHFYFDFVSPYAYVALDGIEAVGAEFGRKIEWHPILVWAVLKAHGISPPMDAPVKREYFLHDMERSAAFLGVPYREPVKLPLSSHMAARLYYATRQSDPQQAEAFARGVFAAFFTGGRDVSDEAVLTEIALAAGIAADAAREGMKGPEGRALLEQAIGQAVAAKVVGSPYFLVDGEGFFGADRLPQLRWHLSGRTS